MVDSGSFKPIKISLVFLRAATVPPPRRPRRARACDNKMHAMLMETLKWRAEGFR